MWIIGAMWRVFRRFMVGVRWVITVVLMWLLIRQSTLPLGEPYYAVASHIHSEHFDYIGWELGAIGEKLVQAVRGDHRRVEDAEGADIVRAYFGDVQRARELAGQIEALYSDPATSDPDVATSALRAERDAVRADMRARQTLVEAILERQVTAVLVEQGFGVGGQLLPPLSMRFTGQMQLLVVSPRDAIELQHAYTVEPITVDQRAAIESAIFEEQDLAAAIVPIGGMALYPAMVVESPNIDYIVETFAHEWLHHYFMFYPIGWETEFFQSGEARIINETTASLFGQEIRDIVLARHYPELLPEPAPASTPAPSANEQAAPAPPAFDFGQTLHETRTQVDELLAAGEVEQAEAYMTAQRELFYENGYRLRVLNQAWFAFYGGYQIEGIRAGGDDPIGPTVAALREQSAGVYEWVVMMRDTTTREALLALNTAS